MQHIKKPFWLGLVYSIIILSTITNGLEAEFFLLRFLWFTGALLGGIYLVGLVRTKNYLEARNEEIWINTDFFKRHILPVRDIRKAVLDERPFRSSKFILQDGSVIKFNSHLAPLETYRNFMTQMNIPVEG